MASPPLPCPAHPCPPASHLLLVPVLQLCVQEVQSHRLPEVGGLWEAGRASGVPARRLTTPKATHQAHLGLEVGVQQYIAIQVDGKHVAVGSKLAAQVGSQGLERFPCPAHQPWLRLAFSRPGPSWA